MEGRDVDEEERIVGSLEEMEWDTDIRVVAVVDVRVGKTAVRKQLMAIVMKSPRWVLVAADVRQVPLGTR